MRIAKYAQACTRESLGAAQWIPSSLQSSSNRKIARLIQRWAWWCLSGMTKTLLAYRPPMIVVLQARSVNTFAGYIE